MIQFSKWFLVFWMSFKPAFSLPSFTFIKRPFNSSSLSFIRVVSLWQKCWAASSNFGTLTGDEHRSFYSAILMIMEKCRPLKISAPKKKNVPIQAALVVKNPPADAGDVREASLISGWQSWHMATHCSVLPGESHGQRSLEGYNPQGHKELDTTEVT